MTYKAGQLFSSRPRLNSFQLLSISLFSVTLIATSCKNTTRTDLLDGRFLKPPEIKNIFPESTWRLQISFNENMASAGLADPENYSILSTTGSEALVIESIEVQSGTNNRIVYINTESQQSIDYNLTIANIKNVFGKKVKAAGISKEFQGFGGTELTPPDIVYPDDGFTAINIETVPITFVWSIRQGVTSYTLEIVSDDETENPFTTESNHIDGSPFTIEGTIDNPPAATFEVLLAAGGNYKWRVKSNLNDTYSSLNDDTSSPEYPGFTAIDAVYVYCASSEGSCNDTGKSGSSDDPLQTINGGIDYAQSIGADTVRVAARINDGSVAYNEYVKVPSGLRVIGGFNSDFTEEDWQSYRTRIDTPDDWATTFEDVTVKFSNVSEPTVLQGFFITTEIALGLCVRVTLADSNLVIRKNYINCNYGLETGSSAVIVEQNIIRSAVVALELRGQATIRDNIVFGPIEVLSGVPKAFNNHFIKTNTNDNLIFDAFYISRGNHYSSIVSGEDYINAQGPAIFKEDIFSGILTDGTLRNGRIHLGTSTPMPITNSVVQTFRFSLDSDFYIYGNIFQTFYDFDVFQGAWSLEYHTDDSKEVSWNHFWGIIEPLLYDPDLTCVDGFAGGPFCLFHEWEVLVDPSFAFGNSASWESAATDLTSLYAYAPKVVFPSPNALGTGNDNIDVAASTACDLFVVGEYFEYAGDGIAREIESTDCGASDVVTFSPAIDFDIGVSAPISLWASESSNYDKRYALKKNSPAILSGHACADFKTVSHGINDDLIVNQAGCDNFFQGISTVYSGGNCILTLLLGAGELDDPANNGNGLCEPGETCLYHPNAGLYQGHGELIDSGCDVSTLPGDYQNNLTLLKYEKNGY